MTFDNSGQAENLIDFPVLVVLDPSNIDYSRTEPNGEDLRFVDADDSTLLKHEIESWNPGGASYVWVRVPQIDGLSSSDFIYLYHDKAGAPDVQDPPGVWSAGYLAVWHLDDDPSGAASVLDSTINAKHGSGSASMNATNVVAGQIGQATTFDGTADYVRVPSGAADILAVNGENLTLESWVRRNGSTPGNIWMAYFGRQFGNSSQPDSYAQALDRLDPSRALISINFDSAVSAAGTVPNLTWTYLAATKDAALIKQYVSGSLADQTASSGPVVSDANDVTIGAMENNPTANPTEWFVGDIDEVRISNVTRSADWIAAQHLSMTQSFVTFEFELSGIVFEDSNFSGTASDYDGGVTDVALANVDVELYSNTDTYIASTTTDVSGNFSFAVADGTYKLRARTATIGDSNTPPDGTFNVVCGITDPASGVACAVAEQTWGNGAAAYGGQSATVDDTTINNNAGPGDTWVSVTVSGADVPNVNFGFAYNLIVNTNNSGQGSLDQFIRNANAIGSANGTSANSSEFRIPATDPNFAAGVARISPTGALPTLTDAGTAIDGATQTTNNGDTNPAIFGSGGNVGVEALPLSMVAGPEIEIRDGAGLANGIQVQADNVTIRGLAILGFGAANDEGAIVIDAGFTGALVEDNVLGSSAVSFTDPGAALRNYAGVVANGGDNGTAQDNLIGFGHRGVFLLNAADDWTISGNEVVDHDIDSTDGDGIAISSGTNNTISGNLITGSSSQGFVVTNGVSSNFVNNTLTGNGVGSTAAVAQSAAITMRSTASSTTIDRNIVHDNYGAGIQVNDGATGTVVTQNSFAGNGTVLARDLSLPTDQIGIDLNVASDDNNFGTPDYYSINTNADSLQDFPIIDTALISGGNLTLTGWSKPGATIELFIAAADGSGFGEGETYVGTFVEGSLVPPVDTDSSSSPYSGLINGLDQGSDTTSRYSFTVPVPAGVSDGTQLTATATFGGETSEFSGLATAAASYEISGNVFEDADFVGTASDYDGGTNDLALPNVDVELYTNADAYISSTATDGSGNFSFAGLANGTYKVRARAATLGDSNTPPSGTFNTPCGITDPVSGPGCVVAEQTWGHGAAVYGGQSATSDDTATDDNAGPGDNWVSVTVSGTDVSTVNFGFAYNLIVSTNDAGQGSLRQFMENANAIGAAGGTTANTSEFRIPLADPNYNAVTGAHTITLASPLPVLSDAQTTIDGQTQTDNVGSTNAADFTHPVYGAAKAVGTGVDGITGSGDEPILPAYPSPEIEINGNDQAVVFTMAANSGVIKDLALYNTPSFSGILISGGTANVVEDNYVGLRADGSDPGVGLRVNHGIEIAGGTSAVRDNVVGYTEAGGMLVEAVSTVSGNDLYSNAMLSANGDGISTEGSAGQAITIRENRIDDTSAYAIETWNSPGPFTIENNTVSDSGNGGGNEIGGIRVFGSNSTVRYNLATGAVGAGIAVSQTGGSSSRNLISRNSIYANGGLGIDIDATDFVSPDGDGVTPNNGVMNAGLPNDEMDYPVIRVSTLGGSTLHIEGYVGTAATRIAAVHTIEIYKAADDGNNNGEVEAGDTLSVPHGEGQTFIDSCSTAVDGTFVCDLTVPGPVLLSVGDDIVGIAYDALGNTSEFSANAAVTNEADLVTTKVLDPSTPGPFAEGDAVTYLLTVTNNGPAQATNVTTTDTYPAEITLGVPAPSAPTTYDSGTGLWTIGILNSGASATLSLPGTVNAGTAGDVVTNSVTAATGDQADATTVGDDLVETFTVLPLLSINNVVQVETDSGPGTTTFTFTISINQAIGTDVTFDFDTADNTATVADSDYIAISGGSGTILAGDTSTTIDVTVNGDDAIEPDETFFVDLSNVVGAAVADGQGEGTITNDDGATVSVVATTNGNEAGPVDGQFTVTQSTTSASDTIITYTVGGTATPGGTDYTSLGGNVTVPAGATTATIDVTGIVADLLIEGTETVIVTLTGTDNAGITVAPSPADSATISIIDADTANVSIAAVTDGSEAGPVDGQFTVTQSVTSISDTVINYTVAGTATAGGTDYASLSGSVAVLAGDTTATIDVTGIVADALIEGTETVIVTLTGTDNPGIAVATSPADSATVNILDNSAANVSIAATIDANETGPVDGQFTVTQSTTSASDTVITYTVAGTATAGGTDYASLSGSVTVVAGSTSATIDVTGIVADALVEGIETVIVTLTGTDNPGIAVAASPADTATVNILDSSSATVSITSIVDANEAGPVDGQFMVTQSTASVSDTVVTYTVAGSATATTDYAALSGSVTILAGDTAATIDVTGIVADALVEGNETVIVTLTGTDNPGVAVDASPDDTATVNILDNNGATVSIAATTDADEAGPVDGQFTITQSATSASDTVISYTVAGTATAGGTDYATLSGSVTVFAGATTATIDVTGIVADALIEGDETVIVTLTATDNVAITVAASPADSATVNILDDAAATVSIAATTNGAESGPVDGLFTLTQSATAINDTVISYVVAGTATSGSDYTALSGTVTIPAGTTTATIIVPVIDDAVAEGVAETVDVTLSSITSSDPGISIAASPLDVASITIADNDSDLITTKTVSNAVPQEGDSITYTITVTNSTGVQATNASLTDTLPAGVTYVSDDSGGAYDSASGLWSIGTVDTVAPNNVATLNITATVDAGASSLAQPITNTTTAALGDQPDPDTSTDALTADITVDANADLVTTKTVDNASPVENSTIVYTISVLNNGAAQASNVSLVDVLPNGVTHVSDDGGGNYNPVTGAWTLGTLDDGAVASLNITANVDTGAGALAQPISNVTTAALGDQPDPDTTTDSLTADITVNYTANLVTTKTVDIASPQAGDTIVYTLTATNSGPAPATNVSLTDALPAGVTYSGDDGAGAYSSATGVWTIGDLANGAVATLNISATVDSGAAFLPQPITNTATVASADQVDPDATGDSLSADIIVNLIDPNLVQLNKTAGRNRANAGEIVSYSIEIRNTGVNPIAAVRVSDSPARGFKYVPGTAQLDGVPISDPAGGFPLAFDIGVLPGLVDSDGNGVADPGEPGYAVLSYRMVAGSGVAPGIWTNTAIATATCDTCFVSNIASADIEIIEDTLFDLGTIIGKVFYDGDRDGFQDSGEGGIEAAMVALDDGTYALTDEFGRYHFPAVKPGQRLLKINLNSLAGKASATNSKTRIVNVTPGLLAKANFGVIVETVDAAIGDDGQYGIGVDSETIHPPVLINGSSLAPSLLVNGEPVSLASADVRLGSQKIADVVELDNGRLATPIRFTTRTSAESAIKRWKLIVKGSGDEVVRTWKGKGAPPEFIEWDGTARRGKLISSGAIYTYHLELDTSDGQSASSSHRLFGVNRRNSISLNLAGGAFVSASHELTTKAKKLLSETATAIRAYPDEMIVISGHTDSVGSDESNMALAERRARSAFDYLIKVEGLPEEQFVIQAFGESQPIAGNDTAWGRELNRRVEISGDLSSVDRARNYDPYRRLPTVQINASDIDLDNAGTFRTKIDMESTQESMKVLLTTSQGRRVETMVKLPTLHVIAPQGRVAIPIDSDRAGPDILDADSNTLLLHTELLGRTEPGNTVEFNGEALDVDDNGLFMARLPLRTGENYYGLVARNPMGMLRIANLKLTLEKSSIDAPEFVVEPVPQLALQLPPPGIPMTHANLVIPGRTVPGNRVFINDRPVDVDAEGHFTATVELERGENPFTAKVVDQDGHSGQIEQSFEYNGEPMFFMALVDGKISQLETSGNLAAAGKTKSKETVTEGRVAYYLKGHVLGKYLLTSAFDSGRQEMGEVFSDLTAQDNDRLLTNLDPDTLYPVYGDNSTLVYDAQSQSKFYLALESETVTALIGNYALNFTDTELAGYQRTLYGASATYQSEAKDEEGRSRTKVQAFHAKIEQAHVRDELRATGGSLYYLSARNVIEGSEHISVIVRDQDSGLILRRTALQQGLDYSIDYVDGRLLTNRPISSFTADYSLIESDLLGGSAVYLQIDYETALDGFEQTASGARVRQGVGERLAVGATAVDEDQLSSQYSLKAADAEYKVGKNSRLIAEFATSEGNNSLVNVSEDGGLTYQAVPQAADSSGDAYKIAAEIDAGEWFGFEDRVLLNTYFKHLDTGFSANSVTSEQGSEKSGVAANWKISDDSSLLGRHEKQVNLLDGSENTLSTMQWNLLRDQWGLAAEVEDRQGFSGDATFAALRVNYRWTQALSTSLLHQQTLAGIDNDQSTVGVAYRATEKLTLDASATHGTQGDSAQIGAQLDWRGNRFYAAQRLSDLEASGLSNNRLVGVEAPFGSDGAVYSEYHWNRLPDGRQRQAMLGARQRFHASEVLRIEISGEHSAENATSNNTGERYALSIGAIYDNDNGIIFSTRNEYRKDSRSIASEQFLSTSNMQFALGDDLSMIGKYRFSKSESSAQLDRNIDFTEASFGLAYRPVAHDRLNLLTRITRLTNTPTEFQLLTPISGTTSDIFAVDWSYQVTQGIEWVGKQAMRWTESDDDPLELRSLTSLSIQRLNWSMPKKLLLGTEYRIMRQDIADDQRQGFVTELMWEGLDPVILGIGYNFSDVSDNEYVDYDFSTKGPFFRLQGKF